MEGSLKTLDPEDIEALIDYVKEIQKDFESLKEQYRKLKESHLNFVEYMNRPKKRTTKRTGVSKK